jgi:hypothetical protein
MRYKCKYFILYSCVQTAFQYEAEEISYELALDAMLDSV